jgi:hypothetical protein
MVSFSVFHEDQAEVASPYPSLLSVSWYRAGSSIGPTGRCRGLFRRSRFWFGRLCGLFRGRRRRRRCLALCGLLGWSGGLFGFLRFLTTCTLLFRRRIAWFQPHKVLTYGYSILLVGQEFLDRAGLGSIDSNINLRQELASKRTFPLAQRAPKRTLSVSIVASSSSRSTKSPISVARMSGCTLISWSVLIRPSGALNQQNEFQADDALLENCFRVPSEMDSAICGTLTTVLAVNLLMESAIVDRAGEPTVGAALGVCD